MPIYQFTCPECRQEMDFTERQRQATEDSGCPVCGASITPEHFA